MDLRKASFLMAAALVVVGLSVCCHKSEKPASGEQASASQVIPAGKVMHLDVEGMTCNGCETTIKMTLKKLDGVQKVDADYKAGSATVVFDPNKVSQEKVIQALDRVGYKAKPRSTS